MPDQPLVPEVVEPTAGPPAKIEPLSIARLESEIEQWKQLKILLVKATRPGDWKIFGDKPYPEMPAVISIAARAGVSLHILGQPVPQYFNDADPPYVIYTSIAGARRGIGPEFQEVGMACSKDEFFWRDKKPIPYHEVNVTTVAKKSYTNAARRALTACLGMRDFTVEDLRAAGKEYEDVQVIGFRKGKKGGPKPATTASEQKISAKQVSRLWAIAFAKPSWTKDEVPQLLASMGYEIPTDIPGSRQSPDYEAICGTLAGSYEDWQASLGGAGEPSRDDDEPPLEDREPGEEG